MFMKTNGRVSVFNFTWQYNGTVPLRVVNGVWILWPDEWIVWLATTTTLF